jgi:mannose-6-phosphate isomerase class I
LGRILLVTDGSVQITSRAESLPLRRGESALVTAGERPRVTGSGTVFVGAPGLG